MACENPLPGDPPSDWQVTGIGDSTIQGYATQFSVNVGQTESVQDQDAVDHYHIDILRLGYYGGDGARMVASNIKPSASLPQTQPACLTDSLDGSDRLRQLGGLGVVDGAEHRGVGRVHRASGAR